MTSLLFDIVFLVPILIIGILCIITDSKHRKIYNKVILCGFLYGFIAFLSFLFYDFNHDYLIKVVINFIIAVVVSFTLWSYNCWSAGDAKLFSLISFLLPLSFYENSNYPFFPSFNILINLFIPVIIMGLCLSLRKFLKEKQKGKVMQFFINSFYSFFKFSFIYILIFLIAQKVFIEFRQNALLFDVLYVIIVFSLIPYIRKFLSKRFFLNYIIIFLTIAYSLFSVLNGYEELVENVLFKVYLILGAIFLVRTVLFNYIKQEESNKNLPREELAFSLFFFVSIIITILLKGSLLTLIM
ncbi:MAG: prepilin peptidase [Candidatus Paceibacterota bacterium]